MRVSGFGGWLVGERGEGDETCLVLRSCPFWCLRWVQRCCWFVPRRP